MFWTPEEKEAWELLGTAATAIMALPEDHPMDKEEYAHAIHVLQNGLLARPMYRAVRDA